MVARELCLVAMLRPMCFYFVAKVFQMVVTYCYLVARVFLSGLRGQL